MGPLAGLKILEFASIGPAPFCCMMLSDMGAQVVRIDRAQRGELGVFGPDDVCFNVTARGRESVVLNLKVAADLELARELIGKADVLVEGYRPGTMERLGLGPDTCATLNPRLVYGRMTGWGQDGPLSAAAGHDINYISLAGALNYVGCADRPPVPPLNLVGDFGGGGMYLAFGVVCALLEARQSGRGQVVDATMIDGVASLMASIHGMAAKGMWRDERGQNIIDGAAPWYRTYETSDGLFVSVGPIETRFFRELLRRLHIAPEDFPDHLNPQCWAQLEARLAAAFRARSRADWCSLLEGTDACFAPVLSLKDAAQHPHIRTRGTFVDVEGVVQPAPAPRFSRTVPSRPRPPNPVGRFDPNVLSAWGLSAAQLAYLRRRQSPNTHPQQD